MPEPSNDELVRHPALTTAHEMTSVDYVRETFKYIGTGIKVAVIDSGIDYKHPALGGCFGKGCRVVAGYDYVGDQYDTTGLKKEDEGAAADTIMKAMERAFRDLKVFLSKHADVALQRVQLPNTSMSLNHGSASTWK
ncbi:hypothetical protein BGX34_006542 [Mortierella sp. NVP85]|nr:hypothetical protein BGX34_006542 [Mortierella sp. NVP85]